MIRIAFWIGYMVLGRLARLHRNDFFYMARIYLAVASLMEAETRIHLAFRRR